MRLKNTFVMQQLIFYTRSLRVPKSLILTSSRRCVSGHAESRQEQISTLQNISASPRFPGASSSPVTTKMDFIDPKSIPPIATYSVMNRHGVFRDGSRTSVDVSDEQVIEWYKNMVFVYVLDTIMSEAQRQGRLSFYMVSAGEEGIMVGSAAALHRNDIITCQYRETGVFKQRGFTLKDFMSQLMHNKNDPGKGRNMPVHYSGRLKTGVHAVASTLGTQIPHATGAAYALKLADRGSQKQDRRVAVAYFGDGAASEGDFHGALNIAAVRECPVIFICRNNGFAISTPTAEQYRGDGIASRGLGYGIQTLRVDGTDIFAVYEATKEARRRALEDGGRPILLEFMSYRISHHSTSDDSFAYRTHDEVTPWKTWDNPIARLRKWLTHRGLWTDELDQELRTTTRKDILREMKAAEREKKPPLSSIWDDVYAENTEEQILQRKQLKSLMQKYPAEYDTSNYQGGIEAL